MFGANPAILRGSVSGGAAPLLDTLTHTPVGAWALDLERTAYAGSCVRIRDNTSNVETDYGFASGMFDSAPAVAALSADGNAPGMVPKWWNQASGGVDLAQAAGSSQPILFAGSPVAYLGGLTFYFGSARKLQASITMGSTSQFMCSFVVGFDGSSTTYGILASYDAGSGDTGAGGARLAHGNDTLIAVDQAGVEGAKTGIAAGLHTITTFADGTNVGCYVDGVAGTSAAGVAALGSTGTLTIGALGNGSNPWLNGNGGLAAIILWNTYSNSDRLLTEAWLKAKYGTP